MPRLPDGIDLVHRARCATKAGGKCSCQPGYRVRVWSAQDGRHLSKVCRNLGEAKAWRAETARAVKFGEARASSGLTIAHAAAAMLTAIADGRLRARGGLPFKPSVARSYERCLRTRVLPYMGERRVAEVTARDIQGLVEKLAADGLAPSTIRNAIAPLRVIYRRAILDGLVSVNPTRGLDLPRVELVRDRVVSADVAAAMIALLPDADRPLWATAFYAGLRRGELRGLRWDDVDLDAGVLRVERSVDGKLDDQGFVVVVDTKTRAGRRRVPIVAVLRDHLAAWRAVAPDGYVFGGRRPAALERRLQRAAGRWRAAGFDPVTLHEARHTYASLLIDAGVNIKAISTYMGHASVTITLDRYGHLMAGTEDVVRTLLDGYLERAATGGGLRQVATDA